MKQRRYDKSNCCIIKEAKKLNPERECDGWNWIGRAA